MDNTGNENGGTFTIIDKFTGEIRSGGIEHFNEYIETVRRAREASLASENPCYLLGRVTQNQGAFTACEIKRMVDATFECACCASPDVWYPNQYALALGNVTCGAAETDVIYFLNNFELGLRMSGERATRHLGVGDWLKEAAMLDSRLDRPDSLKRLGDGDYKDIIVHAVNHPRYAEAKAWYERNIARSGNQTIDDVADQILPTIGNMRILQVSKNEVIRMDISPSLRKLQGLMSDTDTVVNAEGQLGIVFSGWENDPREIFEIPEIKAFFAALDLKFPYWFWFCVQSQFSLLLMLLCHIDKAESDGRNVRCSINGNSIRSCVNTHLAALIELKERHEISDDRIMSVARVVLEKGSSTMKKGGTSC